MDSDLSKRLAPNTSRLFTAVEVPVAVRAGLVDIAMRVPVSIPMLRWTSIDMLHVTVHFLGNVESSLVPRVAEAMRHGASTVDTFVLSLSELGAFPNTQVPRVIYMDIHRDEGFEALCALHVTVREALSHAGFRLENRAFSAHITLARVRSRATSEQRSVLGRALQATTPMPLRNGAFAVSELVLMQSILHSTGPEYVPLHRVHLQPPSRGYDRAHDR